MQSGPKDCHQIGHLVSMVVINYADGVKVIAVAIARALGIPKGETRLCLREEHECMLGVTPADVIALLREALGATAR